MALTHKTQHRLFMLGITAVVIGLVGIVFEPINSWLNIVQSPLVQWIFGLGAGSLFLGLVLVAAGHEHGEETDCTVCDD